MYSLFTIIQDYSFFTFFLLVPGTWEHLEILKQNNFLFEVNIMDKNFLKSKIKKIINSNQDKIYRNIALTAVITEALKNINIRPIIVGGQAVEFYTAGGYSTMDVDLVTPASIKEIVDKKRKK